MVLFDDDAEVDADAIGNLIAIEMDAAGLDSLVAGGGSEDSVFDFASEKEKLILFDNDDGSIGLDYSLKIECNSVTSDVAEYVRVVEYVRAAGFGLFVGAGHSVWRNVVFDPFETGGTWADDDLKATRKSVAYVVDVYVRMAGFVSDILYDPGGILSRSLFALFTAGLLVCSVFGSLIRPEMSRSVKFAHELPHDLSMMSMVDYELWSFEGLDV